MIESIWKPIKDYEELYEVSDQAEIRNITTGVVKRNIKSIDKKPRLKIQLHSAGTRKHFYVARIVAEAFLGVESYQKIKYRNGDAKDCRLTNLWVSEKCR